MIQAIADIFPQPEERHDDFQFENLEAYDRESPGSMRAAAPVSSFAPVILLQHMKFLHKV